VLNISLAGLIGAIAGTAVAGVIYHLCIGWLDRWLRERAQARPADAQEMSEHSSEEMMALVRRLVLSADLLLFAGLGYWIGSTVWG
jgi:hypothetical protein